MRRPASVGMTGIAGSGKGAKVMASIAGGWYGAKVMARGAGGGKGSHGFWR